ncbi:MAG: lactate racemase domain-containing protein, partial [Candidatus Adiutrix sp.]
MSPFKLDLGLIQQVYPPSQRPNIKETVAREFQAAGFAHKIKPGQKVLITSGSRGIESMLEVLRALVEVVKSLGALPVILPAMGSHGGGTPQGQIDVLAHLGQTCETLNAPIHDDYCPVEVGQVFDNIPVYIDKAALSPQCDHVILVGRIKEHT